MRIDNKIKEIWKDYKYCLLGNSEWLQLYKTKDDFITIYSTETNYDKVIGIDLFNKIADYYLNTPYGFLDEYELFYVFDNQHIKNIEQRLYEERLK